MRRKDRQITQWEAMLDIVAHCDCCRLGLVEAAGAYILPLNFGYRVEEGALVLYFHGADQGKKHTLLAQGGPVTFEMDTGHRLIPGEKAEDCTFAYRSVMGRGRVTYLQGAEAKGRGLHCILAHYTGQQDQPLDPALLARTAVFALRVESWTAKEHKGL